MPHVINITVPPSPIVNTIDGDNYNIIVPSPIVYNIGVHSFIQSGGGELPYIKALTGTSITVLQAEHELTIVRDIRVYNSITGEVIDTAEIILNNNVTIESNFDLTNYSLMIY